MDDVLVIRETQDMDAWQVYANWPTPNGPANPFGEPFVAVTRCRDFAMRLGPDGSRHVDRGVLVRGYSAEGRLVFERLVRGHDRYDPGRINQIGDRGAFVPEPPTDDEIGAAIATAEQAIRRDALDPLRPGARVRVPERLWYGGMLDTVGVVEAVNHQTGEVRVRVGFRERPSWVDAGTDVTVETYRLSEVEPAERGEGDEV